MAVGHFMMAFAATFYVALALIGLGNGLLLPSLSSQINRLYDDSDPRRASAYNIYYVGINIGAFLAPFACGTVGELLGWQWGFVLAGVGMVAGLIIYRLGIPLLPPEQRAAKPTAAAQQARGGDPQKLEQSTVLILAAIVLLVIVYRSAYEQVGNTVALWADRGVNRAVGGWTIPMTWFQALNPLGIFLFTPIIIAHWTRRARKGKDRSGVAKMGIGAGILALSYLMLSVVSHHASEAGTRASWLWLALFFFTFTAGELFILPVGLGIFGRVGPERYAASMIAAWYAAACFGNLGAGVLGTLWSAIPPWQFFAIVAAVAAVAAGLLLALVPWARGADPDLRARARAASAN
jgi:proton-dependent oligopeptide transporter, POT family